MKRIAISKANAAANLRVALKGVEVGSQIAILTRSGNYLVGKFGGLSPRGTLTMRYASGVATYDATNITAVER